MKKVHPPIVPRITIFTVHELPRSEGRQDHPARPALLPSNAGPRLLVSPRRQLCAVALAKQVLLTHSCSVRLTPGSTSTGFWGLALTCKPCRSVLFTASYPCIFPDYPCGRHTYMFSASTPPTTCFPYFITTTIIVCRPMTLWLSSACSGALVRWYIGIN